MNERIRELREQAADFATVAYANQTMATFDTNKSIEDIFEGKFAELIVRECCNVLYDNEMGGYQVNYVLKEHFGVEE